MKSLIAGKTMSDFVELIVKPSADDVWQSRAFGNLPRHNTPPLYRFENYIRLQLSNKFGQRVVRHDKT